MLLPALARDVEFLDDEQAGLDDHPLLYERDDHGIAVLAGRRRGLDLSLDRYPPDMQSAAFDILFDQAFVFFDAGEDADAVSRARDLVNVNLFRNNRNATFGVVWFIREHALLRRRSARPPGVELSLFRPKPYAARASSAA